MHNLNGWQGIPYSLEAIQTKLMWETTTEAVGVKESQHQIQGTDPMPKSK